MITIFCVRPTGFNIGNDTIFLGVRRLLRDTFDVDINIVQVPAKQGQVGTTLSGILPASVHQMNQFGHGVVIGGGNLYENRGLDVDLHALGALRLPLMLFSLSHGRIHDHRGALVPRTDAMPADVVRALNRRADLSLARDGATLEYLHSLGSTGALLGGCPSLLLDRVVDAPASGQRGGGTLLSIRNPRLTSLVPRHEARLHDTTGRLVEGLEADGFGPVRLLCHDTRDLPFAVSLGCEYVVPDDVYSYLALLQQASLVVSFRLHAFVPCVSFGTPAINISYDERSSSLVRTIGFSSWDVDFVRSDDVVADVLARAADLERYERLRHEARPRWKALEDTMRRSMASFAERVLAYAAGDTQTVR